MNECRWIGCTVPARAKGVCQRHHGRTMRAGRRAARGVSPADVARAIHQAETAASPIPDRLDDLAWLLSNGEWPDHAARRCGWTRDSASRAAVRAGRGDVAGMLVIERFEAA